MEKKRKEKRQRVRREKRRRREKIQNPRGDLHARHFLSVMSLFLTSLSLPLFSAAERALRSESKKNNQTSLSFSLSLTFSSSISNSLLQLLQKVRLVHKHYLPPVRVRRRADLGPDPRDGARLACDRPARGPDLLRRLVDVLGRDRDLRVARPLEVFVLGLAPEDCFVFVLEFYREKRGVRVSIGTESVEVERVREREGRERERERERKRET